VFAAAGSDPGFDPADLAAHGLASALASWVLDDPRWLFAALRRAWPIPRVPFTRWAMVTCFDDVQEVLARDDAFEVPFGENMRLLTDGPDFVLGMQDGAAYRRARGQLAQAFRREDVAGIVAPMAAACAEAVVEGCAGTLDAVEGLITLVPTLICEHYYGVRVPDKRAFGQWTMAMSTLMFAAPGGSPAYRRAALAAAALVRPVVDDAVAAAKVRRPAGIAAPGMIPSTIVERLVAQQAAGPDGPSDLEIRAHLIGMITGFVPTNTMAAGHMLEVLLRRPDALRRAQAAARAGDDDLLRRCLFEAMRFMPLNPGPFRRAARDCTVAQGTARETRLPAGTMLIAGTQSAMFDASRVSHPNRFDPYRPASTSMLFGHGLHWCVGAAIAEAQITQTMKALLVRHDLRRAPGRAGRLTRLGPFPKHLVVRYAA
jgi:cytochrome P450